MVYHLKLRRENRSGKEVNIRKYRIINYIFLTEI